MMLFLALSCPRIISYMYCSHNLKYIVKLGYIYIYIHLTTRAICKIPFHFHQQSRTCIVFVYMFPFTGYERASFLIFFARRSCFDGNTCVAARMRLEGDGRSSHAFRCRLFE